MINSKIKKYRFRISNKRKIDDFIKWTLTWCQGLKLEEWEEKHENDKVKYLHGYCDKWVLKNYQDGDIPVIWNEFNEELGKVCLIHCYIIRNGKYIDVRGETENIEDIKEGFDYWPDNNDYQCKNLKEYKNMIRKICHCKKKKVESKSHEKIILLKVKCSKVFKMKIWVDNKEPAPQDFVWCRNFAEAMILIDRCRYFRKIEVISIEQDLGEYTKDCEEYIKLCDWLEEIGRNCPIHIHSASIENLRRIIRKRKKIIE